MDEEKEVMLKITEAFQVEAENEMTKDELLGLIAKRIDTLLENDKDLLMSYLYRLDISMKKINQVLKLKHIIPPKESLAKLIFDRQMERLQTKKNIKISPIDKEWEW